MILTKVEALKLKAMLEYDRFNGTGNLIRKEPNDIVVAMIWEHGVHIYQYPPEAIKYTAKETFSKEEFKQAYNV
ncbi:hypothetical protein Axy14_044 [Achromobacter phage vB_AxyS_19-32_Axy14]|nr:hypothetical protein Axy14_044 [Achromobacter phage vB_AxyS_19-32_Axy14]